MFDVGTTFITILITSPGTFFPDLSDFMTPFLQACYHAALFSVLQAPASAVERGPLPNAAIYWEYVLWSIPLMGILLLWLGKQ